MILIPDAYRVTKKDIAVLIMTYTDDITGMETQEGND